MLNNIKELYIKNINRGDILFVDLGHNRDSIQSGERPVIIVQNNMGNKYSPNITVVPLTTRNKKKIATHVLVHKDNCNNLLSDSTALCEAVTVISKKQIIKKIGKLSEIKMKEVESKLKIQLGLASKPDFNFIYSKIETIKSLRIFLKKNTSDLFEKILEKEINELIQYCNDNNIRLKKYAENTNFNNNIIKQESMIL